MEKYKDYTGKKAFRFYQMYNTANNLNRAINVGLKEIDKLLKVDNLELYAARHTWATTAYYCEIHPGVISEAMGHSSITVTETYLKPFRNKKIDEANKKVVGFIKRSMSVAMC